MNRSGQLHGAEIELLRVSGAYSTVLLLEPVYGFKKGEIIHIQSVGLTIRIPFVRRLPNTKLVIRTPCSELASLA